MNYYIGLLAVTILAGSIEAMHSHDRYLKELLNRHEKIKASIKEPTLTVNDMSDYIKELNTLIEKITPKYKKQIEATRTNLKMIKKFKQAQDLETTQMILNQYQESHKQLSSKLEAKKNKLETVRTTITQLAQESDDLTIIGNFFELSSLHDEQQELIEHITTLEQELNKNYQQQSNAYSCLII